MHHLIVCYGHPDEPASFDQYYSTTHRPLADKIPVFAPGTPARSAPSTSRRRPTTSLPS